MERIENETNAEINPRDSDGIDRRKFLECMAWAGTGVVLTVSGGVVSSRLFAGNPAEASQKPAEKGDFTFVQISDSHIGFNHAPNTDVKGTLQKAIDRVNALDTRPALMLHTGDLTHLSKPEEFDAVSEILKGAKTDRIFYVPGEHDFFTDDGKRYLERFGKGTQGTGWRSFDYRGVHFVGLVNVANLKPGGLGTLGKEQLEWLNKDLKSLGDGVPVVVYAHVPLWTVYADWGWGTEDSEQALQMLRRFGSVTVLNGHIHQVLQKVEGHITFHTARSTAFPQPAPGKAKSPGPIKDVPADKLKKMLGMASVKYVEHGKSLAVIDADLSDTKMGTGSSP